MNDHLDPIDPAISSASGALSASAAARRRLLLKGVGRGGALLAASVPLKTLATARTMTSDAQHYCTISGMHSGVHSAAPGGPSVCTGFSPSYFGQSLDHGLSPCNAWPTLPNNWTYKTACSRVFRRASPSLSLFQVLSQQPGSNDAHWVCAWLNALKGGNLNFPYSASQVLGHYNDGNTDALAFYRIYMETRAS